MPKEYLVIGKNGQVGTAFHEILGDKADYLDKDDIDLTHPEKIVGVLKNYPAKYIINAAAYTAVDNAETEQDTARKINAQSPAEIAKFCAANDRVMIHYSTDYVFPGTGEKPWDENSKTDPVNFYGKTKLEGDEKVAASGAKYLIFRTSWVYDHQGKNFLLTMLKLGKEKEELKVVSDQIGAPTYAYDIAHFSLKALKSALAQNQFPSGVYNLCNNGYTSWHGFAEEIFELARDGGDEVKIKNVIPIPTSEFPRPAKRPLNSRLNLTKLEKTFDITMPAWETALAKCIERVKQ